MPCMLSIRSNNRLQKTIIANEYISDGFIDVTDKYANEGKDKGYDYANDDNEDGENGIEGIEDLLEIDKNLTEEDCAFMHEKSAEYAPQYTKPNAPFVKQADSIEFRNYQKCFEQRFCYFIDFEAWLNIDENGQEIHTPCGFASQRVSNIPEYDECPPFLYSGENTMQVFFEYLEEEKKFIESVLSKNVPMKELSEEQKELYKNATHCDCCMKLLGDKKCRNHDHQSGEFLNILCNSCNLQHKNASIYVKKPSPKLFEKKRESEFFIPLVIQGVKKV